MAKRPKEKLRLTSFRLKDRRKAIIRGFQSFSLSAFRSKQSSTQFFFDRSVLSFGIGAEHSFYYKIDTPLLVQSKNVK